MPYRSELKRPDLKGSFPCSVCGKIFCHSSSLSRHRMQAHFKSYTCAQCNQEISSNDTLRSHMYRFHNITRMFMCRCCNWAFPDKTSLHIHMQSMIRTGTPGDVAVLARSSSDGDVPVSPESPSSQSDSPSFSAELLIKKHMAQLTNNNSGINNNNLTSIFPNLLKTPENGGANKMFPLDLSAMGNNQFLAAWLASNPLRTNNINLNMNLNKTTEQTTQLREDSSEYDELEVQTTEEDIKEEIESTEVSPRSVIVKTESCDKKRKLSFSEDIDVEGDEVEEPPLKMSLDDKDLQISHDQHSPTVSDSHISGSSSHSGDSSKCFDCQVAKGKLSASEEKCRTYEKQIRELQLQIEIFRKTPVSPENIARQLFPPVLLPPPAPHIMPLANAIPANVLQNPAMRMLLHNFMQNQMSRQMC